MSDRLRALLHRLAVWLFGPDHTGADDTYAERLHEMTAETGWLSDVEREEQAWAEETTRRDLDRLDAICDRLVLHRLNVVAEQAIRRLLPPADRAWVRVHSGEYALVGVA